MPDFIKVRDRDNNLVFINPVELYAALARQDFKLFGMGIDVILEFLTQYLGKGGPLPPTVAAVGVVLNAKAWETPPSGSSICEENGYRYLPTDKQ